MEQKIKLEVMTPERLLVQDQVAEVIAPGTEGEFGVRPGHCNFLTSLGVGELRYRIDDQWQYLALSGGYAQVEPERVTVLAQLAEWPEEIDLERAEEAVRKAQELIASPGKAEEIKAARRSLEKALLRVKVGRKRR